MVPTIGEIVGFTTRRKDGLMSLRCQVDGQLRSFDVPRETVISLFNLINPRQNMLQLSTYLPKPTVIHVNGMFIEEMNIFQTMAEAHDHLQTIYSCAQSGTDDDFEEELAFQSSSTQPQKISTTTKRATRTTAQKESTGAKKKLTFNHAQNETTGAQKEPTSDDELDEREGTQELDNLSKDQINEQECLALVEQED